MASEIPTNPTDPFNTTPWPTTSAGSQPDKVTELFRQGVDRPLSRTTTSSETDKIIRTFLQEKAIAWYVKPSALSENLGQELKERINSSKKPEPFFTKAIKELSSFFGKKTQKDSLPDLIARVNEIATNTEALEHLAQNVKRAVAAHGKSTSNISSKDISSLATRILRELDPLPSQQITQTYPLRGRVYSLTTQEQEFLPGFIKKSP